LDLQGKIERFALPEVFQLLAKNLKSGTLAIFSKNSDALVYFKSGMVIYSYCNPNNTRLGDILVQSGKISPMQLSEALKKQISHPEKRLGEIIIQMHLVDPAEVRKLVRFQIRENLYNILTWDSGVFKFYENRFPSEEGITASLSTENLILEAMRRMDELSRIELTIPPMNSVLSLSPASDGRRREISLDAEEWNLLALLNGNNTIKDALAKTSLSKLEALSKIKAFLLSGLVQVVDGTLNNSDNSKFDALIKKLDEIVAKYTSSI